MRILYKFPSRERPDKFFACLDNITSLSRHDDYLILCSFDLDDETMCNSVVRDRIALYQKVIPYWGNSKNKVDAVNRDICFAPAFDILCVHSDDMIFIKEGFDLDILDAFNDFNGLVHFPDQKAGKKLITYAMMHKEYYELDGHVYNPAFESVYCDNYQQTLSQRRGKYKFVDKHILEHRHHIWGYGIADALLKRTEDKAVYKRDQATLNRLLKEFSA